MEELKQQKNKFLAEVGWEVVNQVGGIYTVIRSKAPQAVKNWGGNYCLIGPYEHTQAQADFEQAINDDSPVSRAAQKCTEAGLEIHTGLWLISGRPTTVLLNTHSAMHRLADIKYFYWQNHGIQFPDYDELIDRVLVFGYMVYEFLSALARELMEEDRELLAHFHEWMGGTALPEIRRAQLPIKTIFTTHATLLGRYLAMNDPHFYSHLPFYDWQKEAGKFNVETIVRLERACAHGAHTFTTVSEVTARECAHLLGRQPDAITPNGLNIERFSVLHEVQNLHQQHKHSLERFIMSHFFPSYSFDLSKTLYFFTSGRYEYLNKGYDLTLEALARLNWKMKQQGTPITVVMFFITKQPTHSLNPQILNSRAVLDKIEGNIDSILEQVKERLMVYAASQQHDFKLPELSNFVDDYWKLRYRRTIQSWKSGGLPSVVTHNLVDDGQDAILNYLRSADLVNKPEDKVKIVYHPDFISSSNPLFGMEYNDFVRACHLGVFPSYYEPWGYTPLESLARGVAAITSDLSGFGDYLKNVPLGDEAHGAFLVNRYNKSFDEAADQLCELMFRFVKQTSRTRIDMRNKSEDLSEAFDWKNLYDCYLEAYNN